MIVSYMQNQYGYTFHSITSYVIVSLDLWDLLTF